MKKTIKIVTLLLVLALTVALTAVFAFADTTCEVEEVNVAGEATVTGDPTKGYGGNSIHWMVSDHYFAVNDNDPTTVCPIDTNNWSANYGIFMDFDTPYQFTKLVIQTYGVGRAISSTVATERTSGILAVYELHVAIRDAQGNELFSTTQTTSRDNIVIEVPDNINRGSQIYIWFDKVNGGLGQGIWEVEAYTTESHNWEEKNIDLEPSCTWTGEKTVKCADCGAEDVASIPMVAHTDTCKGTCDECGAALSISHESESCTSTECKKCGTAVTAKAHTASKTDPCDTSCTVCGAEDVIPAPHVHDVTQPCNNDCVKCGAEDVIPDAYDLGAVVTKTNIAYPYSYAVHVANPNDPCDTTCYECGRTEAVKAEHVPDPENPCTVSECSKCGLDGVFAHYHRSYNASNPTQYIVYEPHVRPTEGDTRLSCKIWCGKCDEINTLSYAHVFDDCADEACNICGESAGWSTEREHRFTADSPTKCVDCGTMMSARTLDGSFKVTYELEATPCGHEYDNDCDVYCNLCNAQRYGWQDGAIAAVWHVFDNVCDTQCNDCGMTRTVEHVYPEYDCATLCTVCGHERETTVPHTYSNVIKNGQALEASDCCDTDCDVCGETREVAHVFPTTCTTVCSACTAENTNIVHKYDNACDETCDNAGCQAPDREAHTYTGNCDVDCNACGKPRTAPESHVWQNDCDTDCNRGCGATRAITHRYDNDCDTLCNVCEELRVITHVYTNNCDNTCNVCGVENPNYADHVYGDWTVTKEATRKEAGSQTKECTVCGNPVTEEIPAKGGLSVGGIIAIVAGSVVAVGGGGFALYWFVFRKKFN